MTDRLKIEDGDLYFNVHSHVIGYIEGIKDDFRKVFRINEHRSRGYTYVNKEVFVNLSLSLQGSPKRTVVLCKEEKLLIINFLRSLVNKEEEEEEDPFLEIKKSKLTFSGEEICGVVDRIEEDRRSGSIYRTYGLSGKNVFEVFGGLFGFRNGVSGFVTTFLKKENKLVLLNYLQMKVENENE